METDAHPIAWFPPQKGAKTRWPRIGFPLGRTAPHFAAAPFFATQASYSARGMNLSEAELMQ